MIRTFKQRIYLMSVLPLAVLAVALVVFNGLYRIEEANRDLENAQRFTAQLLNGAAREALVLGNTVNFEEIVAAAMNTSPVLQCITLRDTHERVVSAAGSCSEAPERARYFTISASVEGLSDLRASKPTDVVVGELGILMTDENVLEKRRQVLVQLALSLVLVAFVLLFVGRLLRLRLIEPIERIDGAMRALGERNYDANVQVRGDDELAKLAQEVNRTIRTIATYTRELERHRSDAERALHDADEANMARESLLHSLTEELEQPMHRMHAELTAIAVANHDPAMKRQIRDVLQMLQEAEANFADLLEVASSAQTIRPSSMRDLTDVLADIRRDFNVLSETEGVFVSLSVTQRSVPEQQSREPTAMFVDLDSAHLRKALVYLIRAMARRCREAGVHVSIEVFRRASDELHVSVHLKGFFARTSESTGLRWTDELTHYANSPPRVLGWTERETRIISYLLRAVNITPTFGTAPNGAVNILLDTTCHFTIEPAEQHPSTGWMSSSRSISTTLISDDPGVARLASRGDLPGYEITLVSFDDAMLKTAELRTEAALLIDVSDIATALAVLDRLTQGDDHLPHMIAVCPAGQISDSLGNRLFELGFRGIVQKPLHYGRVIQVVRSLVESPMDNGSAK